jgi:hypothetical protein
VGRLVAVLHGRNGQRHQQLKLHYLKKVDLRRRSRPKGYIFCGPKKLYLTRIKKKQGIGGLRSGALHNGGDCVPLFLARNVQEQPKGECHE